MDKNKLLVAIENLRVEIKKLVGEKNKFDKEVVKKSQQLDNLLNEYRKIIEE